MSTLLWLSSLRYLMRHPWQVGLSVLGIAAGVAVVVSIDLSNDSARRALTLSTQAVAGRATHQIVAGPSGIPEQVYRDLRVDLGVRPSAPVVEGYAAAPAYPGVAFQVLGVDPFAEAPFRPYLTGADRGATSGIEAFLLTPGAVLVSQQTALERRLAPGDTLDLRVGGVPREAILVGTFTPSGGASPEAVRDLLVADIATAQELLGVPGRLHRIDLIVPRGVEGETLLDRVRSALPEGARLVEAGARADALEQMTRAFNLNLTAMSLLALVVGTFLIYNTMTFSVVRRRTLIGTLRALGVTRGQVFRLVLGEAAVIGLLGSALGVALGILLATGLVRLVTRTINDVFFVLSVQDLAVDPLLLLKGMALGMGATLAAATLPALEATTVGAVAALSRSNVETRLRRAVPVATVAGLIVLATGVGLLLAPGRSLVLSFGGLFGLLMGAALLTPAATLALAGLGAPLAGRVFGLVGSMAARGITTSLSRTAVAIAALTVAVSVTVGIGIMVNSLRDTVANWLDTSLQADIYVSAPGPVAGGANATLDPEVVQRLASVPGLAGTSQYRSALIDAPWGQTWVVALDTSREVFSRQARLKEGDMAQVWTRLNQDETVIVSEPFAYHRGLGVGDSVTLFTGRGRQAFEIAGVYYDYSSSRGVVMMSLDTYQRNWGHSGPSSLGIYLAPGTQPEAVMASLREAAGDRQELLIRSNRALREASMEIFDRTFAITSVLRLLAVAVAFIGVLSALMALQLERAREFSVLRAIGFTPRQVWGMVTSQTGVMGLMAGLLSLPVGLALAVGLVYVVNRRSFGWTMQFSVAPEVLIEAVLLAVVAALLAGLYPATRMAKTAVSEALREE